MMISDAPPSHPNALEEAPSFDGRPAEWAAGHGPLCQAGPTPLPWTRSLRSSAERQTVVVACARIVLDRLGKMLNRLANYGTRDAAGG
jgi:hypothetical protein